MTVGRIQMKTLLSEKLVHDLLRDGESKLKHISKFFEQLFSRTAFLESRY